VSSTRTAVLVAWVAIALGFPCTALTQPYARFAVADSALEAAIRSSGADFEGHWNALLVSELRAGLARADSAKRLAALERRVADAEPRALGSHIAGDALALRVRWSAIDRRRRLGASVAESLATVARAARDYAGADSWFGAALEGYRVLGGHRRVAWVLGSLGAVAQLDDNLPKADSLYRIALVERRRYGDARMIGNSLNDLGTVNYLRRRYAEAYPFLHEARTVREASGQTAALSNTFNFLGLVLAPLGKPDSARVCFEKALEITASLADSVRTLPVLANYTKLLADLGDPRAEGISARGIALARLLGDGVCEGIIEHNLGDFLRQEGRYTESMRHLGAAADLRADAPPSLVEDLN